MANQDPDPSPVSATSSVASAASSVADNGPRPLTEKELEDIAGDSNTSTQAEIEAAKAKVKEQRLSTEESHQERRSSVRAEGADGIETSEQKLTEEGIVDKSEQPAKTEGEGNEHRKNSGQENVDKVGEKEKGADEATEKPAAESGEKAVEGEDGFDPGNKEHVENYYRKKSLVGQNSKEFIRHIQNLLDQKGGGDGHPHQQHPEDELDYAAPDLALQESELGVEDNELYPLDNRPSHGLKSYVTEFEALAYSTILEELYLQLDVLGHSFPGEFLMPEEGDFLTYDEKFALEVAPSELIYMPKLKNFKNPFIIDETKIGTKEERLAHKMQKDRAFLQEIIRLVKEEIEAYRTFESLKDNVSREDGRRHEEITLMEREKKAKRNVKYLRRKIAEFREQMRRDEHNRKEMIIHLKDQVFQEKQNAKMDARYTKATLEARNTFNYAELNHLAELEQLKIKELEIQMTRDRLAHRNIEAWTALMFTEIEGKLNGWNSKFEEDLEGIDEKVREKSDVLRAQQAKIAKLTETIEERMVELGPWEEEKEKERQEHLNNMRLYYSARKIQRWWRKFMVKHNLYKKKKGKKGAKGKGAAKKGKKGKKPKAKKGKRKK